MLTDEPLLNVLWDGHTAGALAHRCGVPHVELLTDTDSTLDVAHALADEDAPAGTLIVADTQRAGRGRQGRRWSSPAGHGVWCSVIERPADPRVLDVLSIRIGIRVAEGLDALAGEQVRVKWPNDLMLRAGKLGGILTEARWSGSTLAWVAVGVGVNVIPPPGVPLAAGLPHGVERPDVLHAIVRAVRAAATTEGQLSDDEMRRFAARDALIGRPIISPVQGRVAGISAVGALLVDTAQGREQHRAGTIRFAEES
jgi:BirA family transcriptional regulator, biotin operon repressor / biotin---[acetyl-CoA-carboxylase] ligase